MQKKQWLLAGLLLAVPLAGSNLADHASSLKHDSEPKSLWVIPHTHWEGAFIKTREEYLLSGLPHIMTALHLLETHPDYRFTLDQAAYIKPFLERYPEEESNFRKFLAQGRLQIVGGTDVMLDVNIPSGESWIRQAIYGKSYFREKLGVDVTVGWAIDTFGHHAQMPQLLKLAGYRSYWFQRGVHDNNTPSEFLWQGLDGTRIPAFWIPGGYDMFHPAPPSSLEFDDYARVLWGTLGKYSVWPDRVSVAGGDVIDPEESLPIEAGEFNKKADKPFLMRFGVPTDFESVFAKRPNPTIVIGELNPVYQGVYSSRIELKQWMRNTENILTNAEKLQAIGSLLGFISDSEHLNGAWEPVLFNEAHDLSSGTMVDKPYEDTIRGYQYSKALGTEIANVALNRIASQIDTRGPGIPVLVFNCLGWTRSDIAEVEIGFSESGIRSSELRGASNEIVPSQYVDVERFGDGSMKRATIAFIARDIPAFGYSLFYILPKSRAATSNSSISGRLSNSSFHVDSAAIENAYYRASFNLWTGEMTNLQVKSGQWEALGGSANVVSLEQDGGDLWDLYGELNGARATAMTSKVELPFPRRDHFSSESVGGSGATEVGPVYSQFHICHSIGDNSYETTVKLYSDLQRVDIHTELLNRDKFVRYRVLFPTSIKNGRRFDEIPFGAIERLFAQEFPAQNWSDYGDGTRGVAILNHGIPGNNVSDGTLALSLMRSAMSIPRGAVEAEDPEASTDLGLELGKRRTFDYALMPHEGDWRSERVYRAGWEFNTPLLVQKLSGHPGSLPKQWGFLSVSEPNVVVSALKPGRNGKVILRVYEAAGRTTDAINVKFNAELSSAAEVNLLEDGAKKVAVVNNTLQFGLAPYEIKTFSLELDNTAEHK